MARYVSILIIGKYRSVNERRGGFYGQKFMAFFAF
jgi:hypothetical protein